MKAYSIIVIYCFSGTGNSLKIAEWISGVAAEKSIETEILNIANIDRIHIDTPDPEALLIFVSPVHGFIYPPVMVNFIRRFPKGKNDICLMNTRGGMLIGKFITPGITGVAFFLAAFFLKIKGYSIKAMFPVDMPSNWISLHPGLNQRTIKYLHLRNREKVCVFAEKVISGKSCFKALREIVQDSITSFVSLTYYLVGRFFFSKTYFASKDCDNCGICIAKCPVKAIIKVNNRPFWTFRCESCMRCMSNCPQKAIETGHGSIVGVTLLFNGLLLGLFYRYFEIVFFKIDSHVVRMLLEPVLFLTFLALWYRLIHYLLRFSFVERVMVYTSLTRYKFWGRRYKALKDKEFLKQD